MAGLVPAIHVVALVGCIACMAGTSPAMTMNEDRKSSGEFFCAALKTQPDSRGTNPAKTINNVIPSSGTKS